MASVELTADDFADVIRDNAIVVVDFWADWCGPCKTFAPIFHEAAERYPDITFATVDTEREQQLAAAFDVRSIPTVAVFRDQVLVFARPGALPGPVLDDLIRQVRELDMDEVQQQIARESGQQSAEATQS